MGLINIVNNMGTNPSEIVCSINYEYNGMLIMFLLLLMFIFIFIGVYIYKKDFYISMAYSFIGLFFISIPIRLYNCTIGGGLISTKYVVMFLFAGIGMLSLIKALKRNE